MMEFLSRSCKLNDLNKWTVENIQTILKYFTRIENKEQKTRKKIERRNHCNNAESLMQPDTLDAIK